MRSRRRNATRCAVDATSHAWSPDSSTSDQSPASRFASQAVARSSTSLRLGMGFRGLVQIALIGYGTLLPRSHGEHCLRQKPHALHDVFLDRLLRNLKAARDLLLGQALNASHPDDLPA